MKIGSDIHFINGGQDDYGAGLDGEQFFIYDVANNQTDKEHLHIEKRYFPSEFFYDKETEKTAYENIKQNLKNRKEEAHRFMNADSEGKTLGGIELYTRSTPLYEAYMQGAREFLTEINATSNDGTNIVRDIAVLYSMSNIVKGAQILDSDNPCDDNKRDVDKILAKVETTIKSLADILKKAEAKQTEENTTKRKTKFYDEIKEELSFISG